MNGYLRQSTASQARLIGPFVDETDFKTAETGLTINNTDIKLRANGTTLSNKNSGGGTHQVNGMYSVTWDATDTANVGELYFSVVVAGALQVFGSYTVLEEAVYDALFAASAPGYVANAPVNVAQWSGSNVAAVDSAGYPKVTIKAGTGTGELSLSSGTVTTGAISNNAITAASLAADAGGEIADAVWDEAIAGHLSAGSTGEKLNNAASAGTPPTAAAIADAVWDEATADHVSAGSTGALLGDIPTATENADALLKRDMSAVSGESARSPLNALRFLRNKWTLSGTTLTVTKEDDATSAWTATTTAAAGADPIRAVDPA